MVYDTFENLTDENLPLMQRHRAAASGKVKAIWVGGLSPSGLNAAVDRARAIPPSLPPRKKPGWACCR